jgi:hypothetical protein
VQETGAGVGYAPATSIPTAVRRDQEFQSGVTSLARKYNAAEDDIYRVFGFETGGSYSASQKNRAGNPAIGLIQFETGRGTWAHDHGYTADMLSRMSRTEQLKIVDELFQDRRLHRIPAPTVDDIYLTIYKPTHRGKPDHLHASEGSKEYARNNGLDVDGDGKIYGREISHRVRKEDISGVGRYKAPRPPKHSSPEDMIRSQMADAALRAVKIAAGELERRRKIRERIKRSREGNKGR